MSCQSSKFTIYDLPEEILLRIFHDVLPYQDYRSIRLVCQQWARLCRAAKTWRQNTFFQSFSSSNTPVSLHWQLIDPPTRFNLTPRYSHAVCYIESTQILYVFGGRRDLATSLNDFWRLHLSSRTWERILPTGNYPPPKCSSTLINIDDERLLLFGGRSMIYIDDIHMREQYHNELHCYTLEKNCWNLKTYLVEPGPICDHSASVVAHENQHSSMFIFGGSIFDGDLSVIPRESNDLWKWNEQWTLINVQGTRPEPRRGQSQFTIENNRILIVGGSSQSRPCRDVWIFSLVSQQWTQIVVNNVSNKDMSPHNEDLSYIPFCMINSARVLVTFGRLKHLPNINEHRSYSDYDFLHCLSKSSNSIGIVPNHSSSDENDDVTRCSNMQKRLIPNGDRHRYNMIELSSGLQLYRLDLSGLDSSNPYVNWLPSKSTTVFGGPTRTPYYYSLICARGELVLFGGVDKRKLQLGRTNTEMNYLSGNRSNHTDGTLALVTVSNIPL